MCRSGKAPSPRARCRTRSNQTGCTRPTGRPNRVAKSRLRSDPKPTRRRLPGANGRTDPVARHEADVRRQMLHSACKGSIAFGIEPVKRVVAGKTLHAHRVTRAVEFDEVAAPQFGVGAGGRHCRRTCANAHAHRLADVDAEPARTGRLHRLKRRVDLVDRILVLEMQRRRSLVQLDLGEFSLRVRVQALQGRHCVVPEPKIAAVVKLNLGPATIGDPNLCALFERQVDGSFAPLGLFVRAPRNVALRKRNARQSHRTGAGIAPWLRSAGPLSPGQHGRRQHRA